MKYRGKRYDNGKWVYGSLIALDDECQYIVPRFEGASTAPVYQIVRCTMEAIDSATVGVYTGRKDMHDKELYQGDVICFTYWWFDGHVAESHLIGEIVYLPEYMSFGLRGVKNEEWIRHIGGEEGDEDTAPFAFWNFDEADFVKLGNVHDNPELLEIKHASKDSDWPFSYARSKVKSWSSWKKKIYNQNFFSRQK